MGWALSSSTDPTHTPSLLHAQGRTQPRSNRIPPPWQRCPLAPAHGCPAAGFQRRRAWSWLLPAVGCAFRGEGGGGMRDWVRGRAVCTGCAVRASVRACTHACARQACAVCVHEWWRRSSTWLCDGVLQGLARAAVCLTEPTPRWTPRAWARVHATGSPRAAPSLPPLPPWQQQQQQVRGCSGPGRKQLPPCSSSSTPSLLHSTPSRLPHRGARARCGRARRRV